MLFDFRTFSTSAGLETYMVIISTSFGKHNHDDNQSQATLMFVFSPSTHCDQFTSFWLQQHDIEQPKKGKKPIISDSFRVVDFDRSQNMRKDLSFLENDEGCTCVAFIGLDGAFQSNYVSYEDFLRSLSWNNKTSNLRLKQPATPVTPLATGPAGLGH